MLRTKVLSTDNWTKRLCLLFLMGILTAGFLVTSAKANEKAYVLVDGKNQTGLWLSANVWAGHSRPNDVRIQNALKTNQKIVGYTQSRQIQQRDVAVDLTTIDVARTPALLPIDAREATYQTFWRWGSNVLLDVEYVTASRRIPWRTDYQCLNDSQCKLMVDPKEQFFELSYYQIVQNKKRRDDLTPLYKNNKDFVTYTVNWADPASLPVSQKTKLTPSNHELLWNLRLRKVNQTFVHSKKDGVFISSEVEGKQVTVNPVANGLKNSINQVLARAKLDYNPALTPKERAMQDYANPIERNGYAYYAHTLDTGTGRQKGKRMVYHEEITKMFQRWDKVKVIGTLEVANRGFMYIQPTLEAQEIGEQKIEARPGAVAVFEYPVKNPAKLEFGVQTDYIGALMMSDHLLEAIRSAPEAG